MCMQLWQVAGPCATCQNPTADKAHVHGDAIYCAKCCPACRPVENEWKEAPVTVQGKQEGFI